MQDTVNQRAFYTVPEKVPSWPEAQLPTLVSAQRGTL